MRLTECVSVGSLIEQTFARKPPNKVFSRQFARNGPPKQQRFARASFG
jgi:hypothetical protein